MSKLQLVNYQLCINNVGLEKNGLSTIVSLS